LIETVKRSHLIEAILLCLILALAFFMALYPRLDYPLPLHVDEWMHLGNTFQIVDTGSLSYPDPWQGGQAMVEGHPETGYYTWFSTLMMSTGMPWLTLARIMPAIVWGIITFAAYAWGRKWGFGLEAALFTTFIHTTIRVLGPAFLVPVALGLVFFPICLMLLDKLEQGWRPMLLIMLSLVSLFLIHGTTAVALGLLLGVSLVLYLIMSRGQGKRLLPALTCLLAMPASFLAIFLWNPALVKRYIEGITITRHLPMDPISPPLAELGYMMVALAAIGFGFMIAKGSWRYYALVISTAIFLSFVLFYRRWFDIGSENFYERAWLYIMLPMALMAGYGLSRLYHLSLGFFKRQHWRPLFIYLLLVMVIAFALFQRVSSYSKESYYHVIDVPTYYDFVWAGEELPQSSTALLSPYDAWTFVPITGKYVYVAKAAPWGAAEAVMINRFFQGGALDTEILTERNIDLLYSPFLLQNPDLIEVRDKLYILREEGG
jgi:hypothetical protein